MGDQRNYAALEWVLGEIEDTLKDARQALESYVENQKDTTQLRFCVTHIHQVRGSLQIVEFSGASLLAEEMEQLAQDLVDRKIKKPDEAHEVLMRALLQLPIYLDQVRVYREDSPRSIMPLLNDIRAVSNKSFLTETNLFNPDLSSLGEVSGRQHPVLSDTAKVRQVTGKLREMYQFAAASVLRNIKVSENLEYLEKVFSRLIALTSGTRSAPLWTVAAALIEALKNENLEISVAVQSLLRHLARELRLLAEQAPGSFDTAPRQDLIKNLLYYVYSSSNKTLLVKTVCEQFGLDDSAGSEANVPIDGYGVSSLDPEAVRSVVLALREELKSIKTLLDSVISSQQSPSQLQEVQPVVKRVADTLAVLGINELREKMLMQADQLEELSKLTSLDEDTIADSVQHIIDVDSKLEAIGKSVGSTHDINDVNEQKIEITEAKLAVIRECQIGLEKAKEAIIEYISSQWDTGHLEDIDSLLRDIRGGMDIVPLPRAGAIVDSCSKFIVDNLLSKNDTEPSWETLELLADAMASVEYFLERLAKDMNEESGSLLDIAEDSLAKLGYGANASTVASSGVEPGSAEEPSTPEVPVENTFASESADGSIASGFVSSTESMAEEAPETEEAPSHEEALPSLESSFLGSEDLDSDVDEEIIEVFIEEAQEVQETLKEYVPKWIEQPSDHETLSVVRRAFHTLKGSGRMVEAMDIGELAWSIENMLNRVIDSTVDYKAEHGRLVTSVMSIMPAMVSAFEAKKRFSHLDVVEKLSHWAFGLAEGRVADDFEDVTLASLAPLQQSDAEPADSAAQESVAEETLDTNTVAEALEPQASDTADSNAAEAFNSANDDVDTADTPLEDTQSQAEVPEMESIGAHSAFQAESVPTDEQASDADEAEEDYALMEIFISEAETHLTVIRAFIADMDEQAPIYTAPTDELQRALHTLKGSAKMAQVAPMGQIYEALESFAKELVTFQVTINDDILQLFRDSVSYGETAIEQISNHDTVHIEHLDQFLARSAELREISVGHLVRMKEQEKDGEKPVDPRLLSIFMAEEMTLLLDADEIVERWCSDVTSETRVPNMVSELKTLAEAADQAKLPDMCGLSTQLVEIYEILLRQTALVDEQARHQLNSGHESLLDMVDAVAAGQNVQSPPQSLIDQIDQYIQQLRVRATEFAEPQYEETQYEEPQHQDHEFLTTDEHLDEAPSFESQIHEDAYASASEELSEAGIEQRVQETETDIDADIAEQDDLAPLSNEEASYSPEAEVTPEEFVQDHVSVEPHSEDLSEGQGEHEAEEHAPEEVPEATEPVISEPEVAEVAQAQYTLLDTIDADSDDYDQDILEVFLEESDELIEELDEAIHSWESEQDAAQVEEMKRALHTMKGGARLSGLPVLGDLVHDYETFLEGVSPQNLGEEAFARVHEYQDRVLYGLNAVKAFLGQPVSGAVANPQAPPPAEQADVETAETPASAQVDDQIHESETASSEPVGEEASQPETNVVPIGRPKAQPEDAGSAVAEANGPGTVTPLQPKKSGSQEVVRVNSDLLEELVNLAGETSISRARLEEQVGDFRASLDEVDSTILRLQEQLRRLDIETEAQVLFRQEQMAVHEENFDPLEMDRYSQLQQLSRSLMESASDLSDLRIDLADKLKDAETTLLQQSRVNTTLQEGLMRSRMVPFSRMVPRLRRIVRQVATELGKKVSFDLDNVEGELDRSVLERMIPPFEHMLRNAVDHGIESPEERVNAGKPETGRIVLTLGREGGNVSIRLADDGRGVDLHRVRNKAIERGLMDANANLSDHDIMQFILHAGFSTAENVTQISGRGVGMDVVHSEIKQLGGDVTINSEQGRGTEFVIHLPFTLSVNRALMVNLGQDQYAIPLNTIEGIVRISPFELEHYYSNPESEFEYANDNYKVRYLGNLLYAGKQANLEGHTLPLPIVLVRTAQHTMALQVDSLMGSREIVVKSLGAQFSAVQGLSGATVMGDGSVVVILDPHALVRQEIAKSDLIEGAAEAERQRLESLSEDTRRAPKVTTVMVVDDSVTVRKVTTRLLEREGFNAITAKDGVEALQILQDETPDVMLLDIEMPRMDGFELAKNLRSSQRWKELPIIMITSRTGAKHREHAESLGVNQYLGKPYQEDVLLEHIRELTDVALES